MMDLVVQMKTGCVALVLCLNISVDPPDVIKISPCARMECWIGKFLFDSAHLHMDMLCELGCTGTAFHHLYKLCLAFLSAK